MDDLGELDLDAAERMWRAYARAHPDDAAGEGMPSVERFGDDRALTTELLGLVLGGGKRATSALVAEYAAEGAPLPRIGGHWIACDADGRPRAVLRSVELRIGPIDSVDDAFAYDEGEDDGSRASWLREHERYWRRQCARLGMDWSRALPVVFERFALVWTD